MGRRALSRTKVKQNESELIGKYTAIATIRYKHERETKKKPRGVRKICREVEAECFAETTKSIKLSKSTVFERSMGRESIGEFNANTKRWLTPAEEEAVVAFTIDTAQRGFPLSHKRLKEHVDSICRAKKGESFPATGVGKEWTSRFVERHSDRLHPYWSRPLDNLRARAVNPTTTAAYFDLLEEVLKGSDGEDPISPDCIYGMDETGLQQGVGASERVIGASGQKRQYQQRGGDRENITVLVTICADGTSIPPAVIYKGQAFHSSWVQDNPVKASLGYSKKGYTDGEISAVWIKQFDEQTREKAAGRRRLLLVDGHASHFTFSFLDYARKHNIHVLCYPSHGTHVFQGLDVVVFSVLKREWTTARTNFERKGKKVKKTNFLTVYGEAHVKALTPDLIRAAFKKAGVVPFNRSIVTQEMMAPSLESSSRGTLPLQPPSPIRAITQLLINKVATHAKTRSASDVPPSPMTTPATAPAPLPISDNPPRTPNTPRTPRTPRTPDSGVIRVLTTTSAAYLVSPTPIPTDAVRPRYHTITISPMKRRRSHILDREPSTAHEGELQGLLRQAYERENHLKQVILELQAANVLNGLFIDRVQERLEGQEEKEGRPSKKRKLLGNGLPKLLTDDDVFMAVADCEAEQEREKDLQAKRKEDVERYEGALAAWKILEKERDERVKAQRERYREDKERWDIEKVEATQQGRKVAMARPVLGRIEPKPGGKPVHPNRRKRVAPAAGEEESEQEERDVGDEESVSDSDSD